MTGLVRAIRRVWWLWGRWPEWLVERGTARATRAIAWAFPPVGPPDPRHAEDAR